MSHISLKAKLHTPKSFDFNHQNMIEKVDLLNLINGYKSWNTDEMKHYSAIHDFLVTNHDLFSRNNKIGHITASAVVVDLSLEHVLMIWHEKLQRWLQPGGHVEVELDHSLLAAATRELEEETELNITDLSPTTAFPFDLDVHIIPARKDEPEHNHYDFRFLFTYHQDIAPSSLFKWVSVDELLEFQIPSLTRFAEKIRDMRH